MGNDKKPLDYMNHMMSAEQLEQLAQSILEEYWMICWICNRQAGPDVHGTSICDKTPATWMIDHLKYKGEKYTILYAQKLMKSEYEALKEHF